MGVSQRPLRREWTVFHETSRRYEAVAASNRRGLPSSADA